MTKELDDVDVTKVGKKPGLENFRLEEVPLKEYGQFYSGDTYVVLNSKHGEWNVHFWLGKDATIDEIGTAAMKAVEIDQALSGLPVQYREVQNYESSLFISYFPVGIRYITGGYDSGFHSVEDIFKNWKPLLFRCKGKRNVRCTQVLFKLESLNLGDVFLLDLGKKVFCWMPPESDSDWDTNEEFWSYFGGFSSVRKVAKAVNDDDNYWKRTTDLVTLWKVSDATGKMSVTKVAQGEIKRSQLDSKASQQ
ncbi:unnamed protein product [Heligmosomoides polygyrus]|uniref:Gelsolin-like domain-containing protein n=1 Tax=Heligmosomoides polygyrus TaxID=6339 RepID=A0A183GNE2_HELPZ|nr:unnamed protein product [Heligmosomoides polygyrus]